MAAESRGLQAWLQRQFSPRWWPYEGLSPLNLAICWLIVVSSLLVMLETEPVVRELAPRFFDTIEWVFLGLFAVEYVARVYAAGADSRFAGVSGRLRYMVRPGPVLDLVALLPALLIAGGSDAFLIRLVRLVRILRLARLGRFSRALGLIEEAVSSRRHELLIACGLALSALILSAVLIYLVEGRVQPEAFGSIPRALWWAVATLTTVGYGDVYPITPPGRMVAALAAIAAIGLVAMPAGILAAAFSDALRRDRDRDERHDDDAPAAGPKDGAGEEKDR